MVVLGAYQAKISITGFVALDLGARWDGSMALTFYLDNHLSLEVSPEFYNCY